MQARRLPKADPQPFALSLRIRHPSIDPAELSRKLAIVPEHCFRAGDPRPSSGGGASSSVHSESYWLGHLESRGPVVDMSFAGNPKSQLVQERFKSVTQTLGWALSLYVRFFAAHTPLLRRISSEGGQISLLVAMSADEKNNFSLTPEAARVFAELGITIEFEFTGD